MHCRMARCSIENPDVEPHKDGITALHLAALRGHGDVLTLLLEKGADVKAVDDENWSALKNAVKGGFAGQFVFFRREHADRVFGHEMCFYGTLFQ
jgi:hypothetical protein